MNIRASEQKHIQKGVLENEADEKQLANDHGAYDKENTEDCDRSIRLMRMQFIITLKVIIIEASWFLL